MKFPIRSIDVLIFTVLLFLLFPFFAREDYSEASAVIKVRSEADCPGWAEVVIRERWSNGYEHTMVRESFQQWLDKMRAAVKDGRVSSDETWAVVPKYEGIIFAMIDTAFASDDPGAWKQKAVAMCEEIMKMKDT